MAPPPEAGWPAPSVTGDWIGPESSEVGSGPDEDVDLGRSGSTGEALALVPECYATAHNLIPLRVEDGTLLIASADPGNSAVSSELGVLSRHRIRALRAPSSEIHEAIRKRYKVAAWQDVVESYAELARGAGQSCSSQDHSQSRGH